MTFDNDDEPAYSFTLELAGHYIESDITNGRETAADRLSFNFIVTSPPIQTFDRLQREIRQVFGLITEHMASRT